MSAGEAPFCRDGVHLALPDLSSPRLQNQKFLVLFSNRMETRAEREKLHPRPAPQSSLVRAVTAVSSSGRGSGG